MARGSVLAVCLLALAGAAFAAQLTSSGTASATAPVTHLVDVPHTQHNVHVNVKAATSNTNLRVFAKFGGEASPEDHDFIATGTGSADVSLHMDDMSSAGKLHVAVHTEDAEDEVEIVSSVADAQLKATTTLSSVSQAANTWAYYVYDVPKDRSDFKVRVFMLPRDNTDADNKLEGLFVGDGKNPTGTDCPKEADVLNKGSCDWIAADRIGNQDRDNVLDESPPKVYGLNAIYQPKGKVYIGLRTTSDRAVTYDLEISGVSKLVVAKAFMVLSAIAALVFAF